MEKLPTYTYDLIDALDKLIPERMPGLNDADRQIWYAVGRRSVVEFLLQRRQQEQEEEQGELYVQFNSEGA